MQPVVIEPETGYLSQEEANEYLENLRGLAGELDRAMGAIVAQELPSLQESLHLQQVKSARLADLRHASRTKPARTAQFAGASLESDLAKEIRAATDTLLQLNKRYFALVKHSGDTLRMLTGLFSDYRGAADSARGIHNHLQTWSCEV